MAISGASPRGYNSASGGIPGVTSPVDAITSNLGGLGGIINSITGSQSTALRDQYPDEYFSTLGTLLGNTQRRAAGDISDLCQSFHKVPLRTRFGGLSDSGGNTKVLRDLGLTIGVQNEAINSLGKIQSRFHVRPFDPSGIIMNSWRSGTGDIRLCASSRSAYQRAMRAARGGGQANYSRLRTT
jgi:hypothetical protein